jgi:hypothetical protein
MRSPGAVVPALFAVLEGAALLVARQAVSLFAAPQATQRFAVLEGLPRSVVARTAAAPITEVLTAALTTVAPGSSLVRRLVSQSALQRLRPPTQRRIIPHQPIAAITPTLRANSRSTTVDMKTSRRGMKRGSRRKG